VRDATFCPADLPTFCRLDNLGLEVVGQQLHPDHAVLLCRVVDPDDWCHACGCLGVPRDSVLAPMMLAWVLASVVVGQLIARVGRVRPTAVAGMAVAACGLWLKAGIGPQTEYSVVARNLVIIGLGLGSALSSFAVAAQNAVPTHQTGVATALGTFARSMGGRVASAGLGGLLAA
jgi:hypothetical protein